MKGLRARLLERAAPNLLSNVDPKVVRDYYQSVIDSIASVIYTVDRELRIVGVNRQRDIFALANGGEHLTSEYIPPMGAGVARPLSPVSCGQSEYTTHPMSFSVPESRL